MHVKEVCWQCYSVVVPFMFLFIHSFSFCKWVVTARDATLREVGAFSGKKDGASKKMLRTHNCEKGTLL